MNGDKSGGPAERDEHPLADQQPAGETPPSGGDPTDPPGEGAAAATVTDEPVDTGSGTSATTEMAAKTGTTAAGGSFDDEDLWPALADVTDEQPWGAASAQPGDEPPADAATVPQTDSSPPGGDRRVAPQPPAPLDVPTEIPVAMAAAAHRPAAEAAPAAGVDETSPSSPSSPSSFAVPPPFISGLGMGTPPSGVAPPPGTNGPPHLAPPGPGGRRPKVLIGAGAGAAVIVAGVLAAVLLSGGEPGRSGAAAAGPSTAPAASAAPSIGPTGSPGPETAPTASGSPAPGAGQVPVQPSAPGEVTPSGAPDGAPVAPEQQNGPRVRYQTVQHDPGYFEGVLTFTNQTGATMHAWEVSFTYPGANVKNIWDAVLVRGGDHPVIRSMRTAEAIPPGGSLEVRFGAEGSPAAPADCLFGGRPCAFG
ncbi:cellulose binding domain-containing protein [Actinomadura alba]|uniref:Cellulose binding domain-containing protein n=1 Tax=Actinomadura alba TaxID=406431 RepID=A0ABR7LHQ0_9ACTN|nr:cellulose binding domain-containing protein [Actinomadura alba]MBC6464389.1 cellulose binding domain-containing protein [Actinomadura alba]